MTVVIPAYNAERTLPRTLESLQAQTREDWRAILVDDGSTDSTAASTERAARADQRFFLVSTAHQGAAAARNEGIGRAESDLLLFLDADDWLLPLHLERLTASLENRPELDVAHCGCRRVIDGGRAVDELLPVGAEDLFPWFARYCAIPTLCQAIVRRRSVDLVRGFDPTLASCQDWDFWQRLARSGARFGAVKEILACYRLRRDSVSADGYQVLRDGLKVIARGHSADPRVPAPSAKWVDGMPASSQAHATYIFVAWLAGLIIGKEGDLQVIVESLAGVPAVAIEAQHFAVGIFLAMIRSLALPIPDCWAVLKGRRRKLARFLRTVERQSKNDGLADACMSNLEQLFEGTAHDSDRPAPSFRQRGATF